MQIGPITAQVGEHAFGYLPVARSRSGLDLDIPLHLFVGAEPGPTLLVQGTVHGTEPIGAFAALNVVQRLDPRHLRGTLIVVPVLNRVGFERFQRLSPIDHQDINRLYPGDPQGSLSAQIAHVYFHQVIRRADVMLDFHQGGYASYERYVLVTATEGPAPLTPVERRRRKLALAFGLADAVFFPPGTFAENQSQALEEAGVIQIGLEIGGGAGWHAHGAEDVGVAERGIWNTMRAMGMLSGELEMDDPLCTVYNGCVVLWNPPVEGLFVRRKGMGERVAAGEVYGVMVDPYTGAERHAIRSPRDAVVIPGGREWPITGRTTVAILGEVDEVVDRRTLDLRVSFP
jgi:hypothetical protein